jgi:hypothetical protein
MVAQFLECLLFHDPDENELLDCHTDDEERCLPSLEVSLHSELKDQDVKNLTPDNPNINNSEPPHASKRVFAWTLQ